MADTARKFSEAGADIVDINLGCPTARAVKGNVGSAMLEGSRSAVRSTLCYA